MIVSACGDLGVARRHVVRPQDARQLALRNRHDVDAGIKGRWSQTKIMKANLSLSSLPAPVKFDSAIMNSRTSIWPLFS